MSNTIEVSVFVETPYELPVDVVQNVTAAVAEAVDNTVASAVVGPVIVRQASVFDGNPVVPEDATQA